MELTDFMRKHDINVSDADNENAGGIIGLLIRLFTIIGNLVKVLDDSKESKSTGVKLAKAEAEKNEESVSRSSAIGRAIRVLIFQAIEEDQNLAILLPDILSEISGEVKDVRKLVMDGMELSTEVEDSADDSEVKDELRIATEMVRRFETLLPMYGKNLSDLPADMVKQGKNGLLLKLPQVREAKAESDTLTGKAAANARWHWKLNDSELPATTLDVIALRYCSSYEARINGSELREMFKNRTNLDFPAIPDSGVVEIPVPNGKLVGTVVTK